MSRGRRFSFGRGARGRKPRGPAGVKSSAEAMRVCDTRDTQGGVTEGDWARIDAVLHDSWRALHAAVN